MATEKKSNCDESNNLSPTVRLFASIKNGEYDIVMALLEKGADINACDLQGFTPLLTAAAFGRKEIAELLIKYGANVDCCENTFRTSMLHHASRHGIEWIDIVQTIVKRIQDIEATDKLGLTALHHAAYCGNTETVKLLVEAGADINASTFNLSEPMPTGTSSRQREVMLLISKVCFRFDTRILDSLTLWHYVAGNGWLDLVEFLGKRVPDLEVKDKNGLTGLHMAALCGQLEIVKCLVKLEMNINARSNIGDTPLLLACQMRNLDIVEYLFRQNARCDIVDRHGKAVLFHLIQMSTPNEVLEQKVKFVKLFLEKTADLSVYYNAMLNNDLVKEGVLQNAKFCCQVLVNKYNNRDLPELYKSPVAGSLPSIEKMRIEPFSEEFRAIERIVRLQIQTKGHCTLMGEQSKALCVESVLNYYNKHVS